MLFEVWECCVSELCCAVSGLGVLCIGVVLCCLRCGSVVYRSCAVLFEVWECCALELCCAVSGVADQRGSVGNNSSQLP